MSFENGIRYEGEEDADARVRTDRPAGEQANYPRAIQLLRQLRETTDPKEIARQKESWAMLEEALSSDRGAAPPHDWARVAAEKWFAETSQALEMNRERTGDNFADAGLASLELATQKLTAIITEAFQGVAAPQGNFRAGVAACVGKLRELASFNDEYGQKCDQAGQQEAAASRFSRSNALHDAALELESLTDSAAAPAPAQQEVDSSEEQV